MTQKIKKVKNPKLKEGETKFNILKGLKNIKLKMLNRANIIVANMELANGDILDIPVEVVKGEFDWKGRKYLVHEKYLKYNRTYKMWVGKYHEKLSLPIKQIIPAKDLLESVKASKDKKVQDVYNNLDPIILENFVKSQIVQKVFAGEAMGNLFNFLKIMAILNLVTALVGAVILIGMVT